MRIPRIFTDQELSPGRRVDLDIRAHRHASQVLRLRIGDKLIVFNGDGRDYQAELSHSGREGSSIQLGAEIAYEPPGSLRLQLGIGISRGERMDFAIQKSVELGIDAITPLFTERSMVQLKADRLHKRVAHWRGVLISACEQSGRSLLPTLAAPIPLASWLTQGHDGLMLYHEASHAIAALPAPGKELSLLIGPEGGLSEQERAQALNNGFTAVRLGPRVMRTETAPIAALAAIQVLWGDFR